MGTTGIGKAQREKILNAKTMYDVEAVKNSCNVGDVILWRPMSHDNINNVWLDKRPMKIIGKYTHGVMVDNSFLYKVPCPKTQFIPYVEMIMEDPMYMRGYNIKKEFES